MLTNETNVEEQSQQEHDGSDVMAPQSCLFTGSKLSLKTKEEHTIQQAVGGRIRSRSVSSDSFNEAAGKKLDEEFVATYRPIFNKIGLLTPCNHKTPKLSADIAGDKDPFEFRPGGLLGRIHPKIERDPITHQLRSASAADPETLRRVIKQNGLDPKDWKFSIAPASDNMNASFDFGRFSYITEIAALKSILLTFDHQLRNDRRSFTRLPKLAGARETVRQYVVDDYRNPASYDRIVLGLQYHKLGELRAIRSTLPPPVTAFEHVMIVSGSPATRTLDAIWWVAGVDPYGFRLCDDWSEYPFTCVLISGVLKGTRTEHFWLGEDFTCRPEPHFRAVRPAGTPIAELESTIRVMACFHSDAFQQAIDLVERRCRDFVCECIAREAQLGLGSGVGGGVFDALVRRVRGMFGRRLLDPQNEILFGAVVARQRSKIDHSLLAETVDRPDEMPKHLSWDQWFAIQIAILDDLRPLGLPGDVGYSDPTIEVTKTGGQPVYRSYRAEGC